VNGHLRLEKNALQKTRERKTIRGRKENRVKGGRGLQEPKRGRNYVPTGQQGKRTVPLDKSKKEGVEKETRPAIAVEKQKVPLKWGVKETPQFREKNPLDQRKRVEMTTAKDEARQNRKS